MRSGDAKMIVWASFVVEIEQIYRLLNERFPGSVVHYYGATTAQERTAAIDRFQEDPRCRFFVANSSPNASAVRGLTLTAAQYVVWYSAGWSVEAYLQANKRAHRIGQTRPVTYVHLQARSTVDEEIFNALQTSMARAEDIIPLGHRAK